MPWGEICLSSGKKKRLGLGHFLPPSFSSASTPWYLFTFLFFFYDYKVDRVLKSSCILTYLFLHFFLLSCAMTGTKFMSHTNVHVAHTLSITFWHLPPNSARTSYATEGALFISAQLSTDTVSALWKVRVLTRQWKQRSIQACTQAWGVSTPGRKRVPSQCKQFWFYLCQCKQPIAVVVIKEMPGMIGVVCYRLSSICAPRKNCSLADSFLIPGA